MGEPAHEYQWVWKILDMFPSIRPNNISDELSGLDTKPTPDWLLLDNSNNLIHYIVTHYIQKSKYINE